MRNIVITGAAGGIGRALLPLLPGARLLLIDRPESGVDALASEHGAVAHSGSPLSAAECRDALDEIDGPIHGFAHLAGTFTPDPDMGDDPSIWNETIRNNLEPGLIHTAVS